MKVKRMLIKYNEKYDMSEKECEFSWLQVYRYSL